MGIFCNGIYIRAGVAGGIWGLSGIWLNSVETGHAPSLQSIDFFEIMIQNIIVIFILIATFGIITWKVYKLLAKKPTATNHRCVGCSAGCEMRKEI